MWSGKWSLCSFSGETFDAEIGIRLRYLFKKIFFLLGYVNASLEQRDRLFENGTLLHSWISYHQNFDLQKLLFSSCV